MIYKIKMKKTDFFKIHNKIVSSNLEIIDDDVIFEIEAGSFNILKKSNYDFKIVEGIKSRVSRLTARYGLVVCGILFLLSILYMNIYRISKIEFNRETPINDEVEYQIKSSYKTLFCFDFCNIDYDAFSKKLRRRYFEYPYINVSCQNNVISVYIADVDEATYNIEEFQEGNLVAEKDGIIDIFYVYNGKSLIAKNKHVKAGDILIEGNDKVGGVVMATTYDKLELTISKNETIYNLSSEKEDYYKIDFFNFSFNIAKDNEYQLSEKNENTIFNLFDFFTIKKIEDIKKDAIIKTYNLEEANSVALKMIEEDFNLHKTNDLEKIISITNLKTIENDDSYTFTFILKKYESIGVISSKE